MVIRFRRPGHGDRGSASIEMAVLAPALIALFVTLMIAGRTNTARQAIEAAAFDAARTASLARDGDRAWGRATTAAASTLAAQGLDCAQLTVTVVCLVRYDDIALPGMPGNARLQASFVSPLDQYRSRSP